MPGSSPVLRLPRPGPLWGAYPLREDRPRAGERHRSRRLSTRRITDAVVAKRDASDDSTDLSALTLRLARDGLTEANVTAALAWAARAMTNELGLRPGREQILCAVLLLDGCLAEMQTGEGKTCAAGLAAAVAGMTGTTVHVLTANEYLADRDRRLLAPLFNALGLSSACVRERDAPRERQCAYRARIVYSTARCIAFDYLRDEHLLATNSPDTRLPSEARAGRLLSGLCMAIIDEADSVLIDEASMPLVLSRAYEDPQRRGRVWRALTLARRMTVGADFTIDMMTGETPRLTGAGRKRLAGWCTSFDALWQHPRFREELIEQALHALHGLRRDVDYLVQSEQIVIVDAVSGRPAPERRWSQDLHALVALKEQIPLPASTDTSARITYPRLFARYHHLCGLSGTLADCRREMWNQYGLRVRAVPRASPLRRKRLPMRVFVDRDAQFRAAVRRAASLASKGRPVLMLTDSVDDTRRLAQMCAGAGLPAVELSARDEASEARVIAGAGQPGRVTVATQMAGRGTDIMLADQAREVGGLHILNLQHNRSARVDRQIAGRAGRRGDPGSDEHWIRLNDSPLAASRLTASLRPLAALAKREALARRQGSAIALVLLRAWQRHCERDDRDRRVRGTARDRSWSKTLSFSRIKV